ncbi:hypothetical protein BDW74DRAFT_173671 [Aspergillus multicolor]|uniref:fungal specific transcription factor domain-containing protein n=1 Tax=Aspergillus multicolor TaxID=41759 RepID=UPI003CCD8755
MSDSRSHRPNRRRRQSATPTQTTSQEFPFQLMSSEHAELEMGQRKHGSNMPNRQANERLQELFSSIADQAVSSTVTTLWQVDFPPRALSTYLVEMAALRVSWMSFSFHHATFNEQHERFWDFEKTREAREAYEPAWLALYFAILSAVLLLHDLTDDSMGDNLHLGPGDKASKLRKWFDSALFYLHRAEFLRVPRLLCVQAIVTLRIVFESLGEHQCFLHVWPIAIRQAQALGICKESQLVKMPPREAELCRRLWWSLIITDWLPVPLRTPMILSNDFDTRLPALTNEDELGWDPEFELDSELSHSRQEPRHLPIYYQLSMIQAATVYNEFHTLMRVVRFPDANAAAAFVQRTDQKIADIIAGLPSFLQTANDDEHANSDADEDADADSGHAGAGIGTDDDWVALQRTDITVALLQMRIDINQALQGRYRAVNDCGSESNPDSAPGQNRAIAICFGSSRTIISLALRSPSGHFRFW